MSTAKVTEAMAPLPPPVDDFTQLRGQAYQLHRAGVRVFLVGVLMLAALTTTAVLIHIHVSRNINRQLDSLKEKVNLSQADKAELVASVAKQVKVAMKTDSVFLSPSDTAQMVAMISRAMDGKLDSLKRAVHCADPKPTIQVCTKAGWQNIRPPETLTKKKGGHR